MKSAQKCMHEGPWALLPGLSHAAGECLLFHFVSCLIARESQIEDLMEPVHSRREALTSGIQGGLFRNGDVGTPAGAMEWSGKKGSKEPDREEVPEPQAVEVASCFCESLLEPPVDPVAFSCRAVLSGEICVNAQDT